MPDIGPLHPQIVHFVVALGLAGVALRLVSLALKAPWVSNSAALLIVLSAGASVGAVRSGLDAHENAERVPGVRPAVQIHEDWGVRTRNVLLILAGLEILTLALASRAAGRPMRYLAAAGGLAVGFCVYKVGDLGGDLVYEYAGGVGLRSGEPVAIDRLLVAGLFYKARVARDSGNADEAARLTEELVRQQPNDTAIRLLAVDSKLRDRKDAAGALAALDSFPIPQDSRFASRRGLLAAQALVAVGQADSARALLTGLAQRFPQSQAIKAALEKLR